MPLPHSQTPADRHAPRIGGARLALILVGVMIALPAFVMGVQLNTALGVRRALGASLAGGALLVLVSAAAGVAGARSRKSTYELVVDAFGRLGARGVNGLLALSLAGWFGVIAALFGEGLGSLFDGPLADVGPPAWTLSGAVLVIVTTLWGFKALDRLSLLITPLKLLLLLWVAVAALGNGLERVMQAQAGSSLSFGAGVSMVAGGLFVGATLSPDVCRYARNGWQAALASLLAYGLCFPLVLMLAGVAALASGEDDLVQLMVALGLGIPALLTVVLTAWGTNAANLYSCCLVTSTVFPGRPWWQLVLALGALGTGFGLSGWTDDLASFLLMLSLAIPPVAAIYLVHFAATLRWRPPPADWRWGAIAAWLAGTAWATWMKWRQSSLTDIPALDAFLFSALCYAALLSCERRWRGRAAACAEAAGP